MTHAKTPRPASHSGPRVSKDEAVQRLLAAGRTAEAARLRSWRNKNGTNWGWDGHVRGTDPTLIPVIWP